MTVVLPKSYLPDDAGFPEAIRDEAQGSKARKRQKEVPAASDARLMQIEYSERGGFKLREEHGSGRDRARRGKGEMAPGHPTLAREKSIELWPTQVRQSYASFKLRIMCSAYYSLSQPSCHDSFGFLGRVCNRYNALAYIYSPLEEGAIFNRDALRHNITCQ